MPSLPTARRLAGPQLVAFCFLTLVCSAQGSGNSYLIAGTWRGTSECMQADSPCHDEVNVYRFSEIGGKPGTFSGVASKIVDGKEVVMGTLDWTYDSEHHILESKIEGSKFRLVVNGNKIEGTLRLTDNTLYRRIHLERSK
jgi:hypothetical protein